ncbi:MAG: hypothetical protein JEZ06_18090 [Anaerolineaceae bacterium]|nr:hypothetical protein [Anaerolineaceae bacterium]
MKRILISSISMLILSGCNRLSSIPYSPEINPARWLEMQPSLELSTGKNSFYLMQPSSTAFVYLLGLITILAGIHILRIRKNEQSRKWWGVALLFWGLGALLAGTSYQAFSYEIKCIGRAVCSWTSYWEVFYLLLSAASVDAMVIAGAYSGFEGKARKNLILYAVLNLMVYTLLLTVGVLTLQKFLISFELLLIVAAPGIVTLLFSSIIHYKKRKSKKDLSLIITWVWLGITMAAYFLYLLSGLTEKLWENGFWFSENDVLHIGLIIWMVYIGFFMARRLRDRNNEVALNKIDF